MSTKNEDQKGTCASNELKQSDLLIENRDYYLENGFFVFTASYLKKRGYCCKSGCRHCPY
jgi:hypothetical protein